jgi:hypothetical protein
MLIGWRAVIFSTNAENYQPFLFMGNKHAKLVLLTRRCQYFDRLSPPTGLVMAA